MNNTMMDQILIELTIASRRLPGHSMLQILAAIGLDMKPYAANSYLFAKETNNTDILAALKNFNRVTEPK